MLRPWVIALGLVFACGLKASPSLRPVASAIEIGDSGALLECLAERPAPDELPAFLQRAAELHEHRGARLGRFFLNALRAFPAVENLPEGTESVQASVVWALPRGCRLHVSAAWVQRGGGWRLSELKLTLVGGAAARYANAAPYFRHDGREPDPGLLDHEELDELLPPGLFAAAEGEPAALLAELRSVVASNASRTAKVERLARHAAGDADREALRRASDGEDKRAFWDALEAHWEESVHWPVPSSVPEAKGCRVEIRCWGVQEGRRFSTGFSASRGENGLLIPRGDWEH